MNNDTPADAITVIQADRDLVYSLFWFRAKSELEKRALEYIRDGKGDDARAVQEVALHRTTSLAAQDIVDCETCCGSGEIVTDWERYKHPHEGDVGDEAVAECPDCDGNGKIEAPSLAAQDGLVEALVKAAQAVVDVDTLALAELEKMGIGLEPETRALTERLRQALAAIKGDKS